jgi:hypothetical protein
LLTSDAAPTGVVPGGSPVGCDGTVPITTAEEK